MSKQAPPTLLQGLAKAFGRGLAVTTGARIAPVTARPDAESLEPSGLGAESSLAAPADEAAVSEVVDALRALLDERLAPVDRRLDELDTRLRKLTAALDAKPRWDSTTQPRQDGETRLRAEMESSAQATAQRIVELEARLAAAQDELPERVRVELEASAHATSEHLAEFDKRLTATQEELPARVRALIEALRDSLGARLAFEMKEEVEQTELRLHQDIKETLAGRQESLDEVQDHIAEVRRECQDLAQHGRYIDTTLNAVRAEQERLLSSIEMKLRAAQPELQRRLQVQLEARLGELEGNLRAGLAEDSARRERASEGEIQASLDRLGERLKAQNEQIEALRRQQSVAERNLLMILSGRADAALAPHPEDDKTA